jgi:cyanate permease
MIVACPAFFFLRFFGQGLLAMIPRVMVGRWFERRRGLAVGLQGLFVSFGFGAAPLGLNALIESFGWQGAYVALALVVGAGMTLVGWVFYRERPEDHGLMRDGKPFAKADGSGKPSLFAVRREYDVVEARRTYIFWIYSIALASQGLVITAVTFHIVSLSVSSGITEQQGLSLFLPMAIINVIANLSAGWISDRIRLKWILLVMMAGQALGGVALLFLDVPAARALVVIGFGISGGLFGTLIGVAWPRFFGTVHLGAISGLNMSVMVLASSLGPILFGALYDRTGSYDLGVMACVGMSLAIFTAGLWANNPQMAEGN